LGQRGEWSSTVCRALADALVSRQENRGRTSAHELAWIRLLGWCLRPGFGAPGDGDRVDALWALAPGREGGGLVHATDKGLWSEWWILWRRVASGLTAIRQQALFDAARPWLGGGNQGPGPQFHGLPEMLRMVSTLERLSPKQKEMAGAWVAERRKKLGTWWPLGRLGARLPFHGDARDAVPQAVAQRWLEMLLDRDWRTEDGAAFAAVLIARPTGEPAHDIAPEIREQVVARLRELDAPSRWVDLATGAAALGSGDAKRVFGDALPAGLRLS
jgi:hypothetical protein